MKFSDGSDQFHNENQNTTYVSRLQCVQASIESQIIAMKSENPHRKVGLVTFNNEVTVIGDGTEKEQIIAGDNLSNFEYLKETGTKMASMMANPIEKTHETLINKLYNLEETGPTALGPALFTAISMAAQGSPGSIVNLCTDGIANIGLGAIDEAKDQMSKDKVNDYYETIGKIAKAKGVTVNIISIIGEECDLQTLSQIPEVTGGDVQRMKAEELTKNFGNVLNAELIATKVVMKVKIHEGIEFRNEDKAVLSENNTLLTKELGNVTTDTVVTFEYRMKETDELEKLKNIDMTKVTRLPFQTQLEYTKLDGMRCIRSITKVQDVSHDKEEAAKDLNAGLIATNVQQRTAQMAKDGNFREAQAYSVMNKNFFKKNIRESDEKQQEVYHQFKHQMNDMYGMIHEQNNMEDQCMDDAMDEECEELCAEPMMMAAPMSSAPPLEEKNKKGKKKRFFSHMNDQMSENIHRNAKASYK